LENRGLENYATVGNFITQVVDGGYLLSWDNLSWRATIPANASITWYTRSGKDSTPDNDNENWSDWSVVVGIRVGHDNWFESNLISPDNRYLQLRATFTGDGRMTPLLHDYTVYYRAMDDVRENELIAGADGGFSTWITLAEGMNIIRIMATDPAGNESSLLIENTVYIKLRGGEVTFENISAGQSRAFAFVNCGPLLEVVVTARNHLTFPTIAAEATQLPTGVPPAPGAVHSYLIISTNVAPEDIQSIELRFRVEKSWLNREGVDKNAVELWRFDEVKGWQFIRPRMISEDRYHVYYSARLSSLSLFAVAGGRGLPTSILYALPVVVACGAVAIAVWRTKRLK
jgi:PGF-pre-PGF domain-containing protein